MFKKGELVTLVDTKEKKYLVTLKEKESFSFHKGKVELNQIIGKKAGDHVFSSKGEKLLIFRPTLWEYVLKMERGAQIIYPKDISQIITFADIFPGSKVFEAGTGSGALTLHLLRAVGNRGEVVSYESRKEFLEITQRNIERFSKEVREEKSKLTLKNKDIEEGIEEKKQFDRGILDLPEPWKVLGEMDKILKEGSILVCYLPTTTQITNLISTIKEEFKETFYLMDIHEIIKRRWKRGENNLRPEDRMVAHTGFIILIRKLNKQ